MVRIKHADGIITEYVNLGKGTVIKALKKLGVKPKKLKANRKYISLGAGIPVKCGTTIGGIGSSGHSKSPRFSST